MSLYFYEAIFLGRPTYKESYKRKLIMPNPITLAEYSDAHLNI